jgi:transposase
VQLSPKRGKKRVVMAFAHSILIIDYHMIQRREPYHELGGDYFDKRRPEVTARRLIKRLEQLGFQVDCRLPTQTVG